MLFFYLGREIVRFEVGGFVVNEGVVHRTPVANHKSRLQTHHFLGRGRSNVSHPPTSYVYSANVFVVYRSLNSSWVFFFFVVWLRD